MICIGFGASDSLRSKLIRWATASDWSHVWVEYPSTCWGGQWAAHSTEYGVVKEQCERVRTRYDRTYIFEVKGFDITNGMKECGHLLGRRYDFKVIWNALLLVVHRATKWKWLWSLASRDISRLTCSEFVATVMKRAGLSEAKGLDPEFTTPGDLFKLCKASKTFWML